MFDSFRKSRHLFARVIWARTFLPRYNSEYRILYEDPALLDAPVKIITPDPNALAALMFGGIVSETCHSVPHGSMSESQALGYIAKRVIPERVLLANRSNRTLIKIIKADSIPTSRKFRDAWAINQISSGVSA